MIINVLTEYKSINYCTFSYDCLNFETKKLNYIKLITCCQV